ncbi:MAG: rod shape-determining protein MreD [Melioribacteraceae bacterium]|nr:rod shape-determining protein MreD [Melioribacteraceae bacterium]
MLLNYLKPVLYFIPLAALQLVVVPLMTIYEISPNLILVLIVYFTMLYGQIYGTILGFVLGFLFDIISGGLLGASMLSFTVSVFIAGYFYNENKVDTNTATFLFTIIVFLCGSINSFLFSSIAISNPDVKLISLILEIGLLPGLYTAVFSLPIVIFTTKKGIE